MPIKSSYAKDLIPSIDTFKDVLGLEWGGVAFGGLAADDGGRYVRHMAVNRVFCTCGYSGAKLPVDSTYNYGGHCPHCGKPLIFVNGGNSYGNADTNKKTGEGQCTVVEGDELKVFKTSITITPNLPATPTNKDWLDPKNMEYLRMEAETTPICVFTKASDGTITVDLKPGWHRPWSGSDVIEVAKTPEVEAYLGWMADIFDDSHFYGGSRIRIDLCELMAIQNLPNVFSKENKEKDGWEDAMQLYEDSALKAWDGSEISHDVTMEQFFEQKGYPMELFGLDCAGRWSIKATKKEFDKFMETDIGKVVMARTANGQTFSSKTLENLVDVALVLSGDRKDKDVYYGYQHLFESFMKDSVDHFEMKTDIVAVFIERVRVLKERGVMPTEDTIRTRNYCSIINAEVYNQKKPVDINAEMVKDPLGVLRQLQVKKM